MRAIIILFFMTSYSVLYAQQNDTIVSIPKDEIWGWHREFYCSAGVGFGFENSFHSNDLITKYKFGFSYKKTGCYSIADQPMSYLIWLDTKQGVIYKIGASVNFYINTQKGYSFQSNHRLIRYYMEHLILEAGFGLKRIEGEYFPMVRLSPKINYTVFIFERIGSNINLLPFYSFDINYNSKLIFDNSIGIKLVWQIGFWK